MDLFYSFTRSSLRLFFKLCYRHSVQFVAPFPKGPAILAANHISFFDPPIIAVSAPEEIHFFARKSLFKNPLFRFLISNLNAHPVGEGNEISAMKLALKLLSEGKKILIFPEGTRSDSGTLIPFKQGIGLLATRSKAPIIPTYIDGSYAIWPKTRRFPVLFGPKTTCIFGKAIFPEEDLSQEAITDQAFFAVQDLQKRVVLNK